MWEQPSGILTMPVCLRDEVRGHLSIVNRAPVKPGDHVPLTVNFWNQKELAVVLLLFIYFVSVFQSVKV